MNLYILLTFALTALAVYLLVRYLLDVPLTVAVVSGLAVAFAQFRFIHVAHVETLSTQFFILALYAFHRFLDTPGAPLGDRPGGAVLVHLLHLRLHGVHVLRRGGDHPALPAVHAAAPDGSGVPARRRDLRAHGDRPVAAVPGDALGEGRRTLRLLDQHDRALRGEPDRLDLRQLVPVLQPHRVRQREGALPRLHAARAGVGGVAAAAAGARRRGAAAGRGGRRRRRQRSGAPTVALPGARRLRRDGRRRLPAHPGAAHRLHRDVRGPVALHAPAADPGVLVAARARPLHPARAGRRRRARGVGTRRDRPPARPRAPGRLLRAGDGLPRARADPLQRHFLRGAPPELVRRALADGEHDPADGHRAAAGPGRRARLAALAAPGNPGLQLPGDAGGEPPLHVLPPLPRPADAQRPVQLHAALVHPGQRRDVPDPRRDQGPARAQDQVRAGAQPLPRRRQAGRDLAADARLHGRRLAEAGRPLRRRRRLRGAGGAAAEVDSDGVRRADRGHGLAPRRGAGGRPELRLDRRRHRHHRPAPAGRARPRRGVRDERRRGADDAGEPDLERQRPAGRGAQAEGGRQLPLHGRGAAVAPRPQRGAGPPRVQDGAAGVAGVARAGQQGQARPRPGVRLARAQACTRASSPSTSTAPPRGPAGCRRRPTRAAPPSRGWVRPRPASRCPSPTRAISR